MRHNYDDIRSRIAAAPLWWDEHAVPRYAPFDPSLVANIYAVEAALVEIECQACRHPFLVAFSIDRMQIAMGDAAETGMDVRTLHYGDPPNIGCCPAGPTMNSIPRRVVQFWTRPHLDWIRRPSEEVPIVCEWAQ